MPEWGPNSPQPRTGRDLCHTGPESKCRPYYGRELLEKLIFLKKIFEHTIWFYLLKINYIEKVLQVNERIKKSRTTTAERRGSCDRKFRRVADAASVTRWRCGPALPAKSVAHLLHCRTSRPSEHVSCTYTLLNTSQPLPDSPTLKEAT